MKSTSRTSSNQGKNRDTDDIYKTHKIDVTQTELSADPVRKMGKAGWQSMVGEYDYLAKVQEILCQIIC